MRVSNILLWILTCRRPSACPNRRWILCLMLPGCLLPAGLAIAEQPEADGHEPENPPREVNFLGLDAAPLDEPLVTDRPDFTESTKTVPWGRMQLEGGYTYTADDEGGVRTGDHSFPEFLLRVGIVEDFEFRLGWLGWSLTESMFTETNDAGRRVRTKQHDDGATDMSVGFKARLFDRDGFIPEFGIIGELSLPTGSSSTGKTSGDVDPGVKLLWAYDLTDDLALSGNINFAVPTEEDGRFFQSAASISLAYGITDRLGVYTEYFGIYPNARGSDCAHTLNGGFTYLLTDNLQFDIRSGVGLNEEADDCFVGAGFAIRF